MVADSPDDARTVKAWLDDATTAANERRFDDAASRLEAVLAAEPNHLHALDLFGFVRYFQGRPGEAEQLCRRALALSPQHAYAHKGLGLCLARQGHLDDGVASLRRAMELEPGWADPYWDLAVVLHDAGRFDEAIVVLEQGARMAPKRAKDFQAFQSRIERRRDARRA